MNDVLFPYQTIRGDLTLTITGAFLDDGPFPKDPFIKDRRMVRLHDVDKEEWSIVRFELELTGPEQEIGGFEQGGHKLEAVAAAHCPQTNCRQSLRLRRNSGVGPVRWTGTLELSRSLFRGRVELIATVTGTAAGLPNRVLGSAPGWSIDFDEADIPQIEGTLRVRWVDFGKSEEQPMLREYADQAFYTDLAGTPPTLYLNKSEDFRGLQALLDDRPRASAWDKALHDAERTGIVRSVWMAMLNASLAAIQDGEDGELPDWPVTDWKRQVLQAVLPRIYAEKSEREALQTAWEIWNSGPGADTLESMCEAQISTIIGSSRLLRKRLSALSQSLESSV